MNKGNPRNESLAVIAAHCARTQPDSITERKALLEALAKVMTVDHPALIQIKAQLATIATLEQQQRDLPGFFEQ